MTFVHQLAGIRNLDCDMLKPLHELCTERFPMFPDFIPSMIQQGIYTVTDSQGKRLPPEEALSILEK